jgi:hypothetical protein
MRFWHAGLGSVVREVAARPFSRLFWGACWGIASETAALAERRGISVKMGRAVMR